MGRAVPVDKWVFYTDIVVFHRSGVLNGPILDVDLVFSATSCGRNFQRKRARHNRSRMGWGNTVADIGRVLVDAVHLTRLLPLRSSPVTAGSIHRR
jgi:hypothetical protein